jgi:hypothetical protein
MSAVFVFLSFCNGWSRFPWLSQIDQLSHQIDQGSNLLSVIQQLVGSLPSS